MRLNVLPEIEFDGKGLDAESLHEQLKGMDITGVTTRGVKTYVTFIEGKDLAVARQEAASIVVVPVVKVPPVEPPPYVPPSRLIQTPLPPIPKDDPRP